MPLEDLSDEKLIRRYLKGDETAFAVLLKRYLNPALSLARRFVGDPAKAEDVVQETFVKVWKNLKKFDTQKKFKPWLFAIAKNTALDWLNKREALPFSSFQANPENSFFENIVDSAPSVAFSADQKMASSSLRDLVSSLPGRYHSVLFLRHEKELSFREIAEKLEEPLNTVKSRYRRAIALIKKRAPDL
ncbi:MAG TPA: sigma-70 family RNA polymerase sigma factor [Candidatus Tyrphobacter sp.]|nr:sigma-70 family RNA polymerase sigma factor [Candidatus Tyrphobacter sp.]